MAWFKVDDGLADHRKVRRLGRDKVPAMGLWVLCGSWAARNLTDGFVPAEVVQGYDPKLKMAARLVEVILWEPAEMDGEPGYLFHDWSDQQPTRADVEKSRRDNARRQQEHRGRQRAAAAARNGDGTFAAAEDEPTGNALFTDDTASSNALRNGGTNGVSNSGSHPAPVPARPVPSSSDEELSSGSRKREPRRRLPDTWAPSQDHARLAAELGLDLVFQVDAFRDHAEANDRRLARWDAGFRQWLKKADEINRSRPGRLRVVGETPDPAVTGQRRVQY